MYLTGAGTDGSSSPLAKRLGSGAMGAGLEGLDWFTRDGSVGGPAWVGHLSVWCNTWGGWVSLDARS